MATVRVRLVSAVAVALIASVTGGWPTEVAAQSPTPTPTLFHGVSCVGDCNDDSRVTVDEIVTGVNIALDRVEVSTCLAFECDRPNVDVFVNCGVEAVRNALGGCPTRTPTVVTPLPTPTPTSTVTVSYELAAGSAIVMSSSAPGSLIVEPLSGTFVVKVECGDPGECRYPNTFFALEITSMDLESAHFTVAGTGYIDVSTLSYPYAALSAHLLINDQQIGLSGGGATDSRYLPARFDDVEICGDGLPHAVSCEAIRAGVEGGYVLTLFAVPRQ